MNEKYKKRFNYAMKGNYAWAFWYFLKSGLLIFEKNTFNFPNSIGNWSIRMFNMLRYSILLSFL